MDELADQLPSVRLLDVRWRLSDAPGDGGRRYADGHLPGARFLDLEAVLTSHTGDPLDGRHPLPDTSTLAEGLGALGVRPDDDLVVYDEPGSFAAERAWWVLRWAGLRARVLDGGIDAWVDGGTAAGDRRNPGRGGDPAGPHRRAAPDPRRRRGGTVRRGRGDRRRPGG